MASESYSWFSKFMHLTCLYRFLKSSLLYLLICIINMWLLGSESCYTFIISRFYYNYNYNIFENNN